MVAQVQLGIVVRLPRIEMESSRNPASESEALCFSDFFEYKHRPSRDSAWGVLYILLLTLVFAGGIYSAVHW